MINPIKETIDGSSPPVIFGNGRPDRYRRSLLPSLRRDASRLQHRGPSAAGSPRPRRGSEDADTAGFEPNIATQGPAKDANIRVIFVDRIGVAGIDGNPVGKGATQFVYLAVPVKVGNSGATAQLVVAGLASDPADVPGPFLAFTQRRRPTKLLARQWRGAAPPCKQRRCGIFAGAGGETLQLHAVFDRVPARRTTAEVLRVFG